MSTDHLRAMQKYFNPEGPMKTIYDSEPQAVTAAERIAALEREVRDLRSLVERLIGQVSASHSAELP